MTLHPMYHAPLRLMPRVLRLGELGMYGRHDRKQGGEFIMWRIAKLLTTKVSWKLGAIGLFLILVSNVFDEKLLKVDIDNILANLGALLLIIGILQFLYDTYIRGALFRALLSEIIKDQSVAESGICEYRDDSKGVEYSEDFLSSEEIIVGVNYSARILDNSIDLVHERVHMKKSMVMVHVKQDS